jgi:peptide/nickel transport system permease protein
MKFLIKRLLYTIVLLCGIVIINFSLFFLSPGDPTNLYFGPKVKRTDIENLKRERGLDQPWTAQFQIWLGHTIKGDLGYSWAKHRPVGDILKEAIPATLQLTVLALFINLIVGCMVGILAGIKSHRLLGKFLDTTFLILYSVPVFLLALLFIYIFSLKLQLLPASGMHSFLAEDMGFWGKTWDRLSHLVLPVMILGLTGAAATSRYVQDHMSWVLKQNYIRLAHAKGLSRRRVYVHHAFKNSLIPVATLLGLYFPFLLGSAFIVEVIFAWPGMGRVVYEAIFSKDYPVIMAVNLIAGIMVIIGNIISDCLYRFIDPRIRIP